MHLVAVLDLASREVIGWSMDTTMRRELVIDALQGAVVSRRPKAGTLFHPDRGSQYASLDFRTVPLEKGITASMIGKGDCWDNAVVESFFGTMKRELGNPIWTSKEAARAAIFEYIEIWYNRRRRHSTLGYSSLERYESMLLSVA